MSLQERIKSEILIFDGAMGTMLQKAGLKLGEVPEKLNIEKSEVITQIHKEYINAGADIITTNTFGANRKKMKGLNVEEVITCAISNAKIATEGTGALIAQDIGPIGEMLEPMGMLSFDEAYEIFKEQVVIGVKNNVDLFIIETMTDLYELKCAILACKENSSLPVIATMSFEENERTFTGCSIESMIMVLEGLGVDALGVNCSLGPIQLKGIVEKIVKNTNMPVIVQANAGLPKVINGETCYDITAQQFASCILEFVKIGVNIVGGCCGTTPLYINNVRKLVKDISPIEKKYKEKLRVCSPSVPVNIDHVTVIGERINPTGKKMFKQALLEGNMDYILNQGIEQVKAGADILDVNVGLPEIDEPQMMKKVVCELQAILNTPLQIDSSDKEAIETGLRYYNGKAIVNSVNGEDAVLDTVLPLVKKYGAAVVGLTLSEAGIPKKAEERFLIAKKILNKALEYGIKQEDVIIDCLTLTASAQQEEVFETIKALKMVKDELNLKTVLGVSNISFGLPNRELINKTFLSMALGSGLDLPIINPNVSEMMGVIDAYKVLMNIDKGSNSFIDKYVEKNETLEAKDLKDIVVQGLKEKAKEETNALLKTYEPLTIVNEYLIPSLDIVSKKYDTGEIFLPQLIQAAQTVKEAFEVIKLVMKNDKSLSKGKMIVATVKGDIHDIGKNIAKIILENYGYDIIDLGIDVSKEKIIETAKRENVKLIGLSALMTTTIKSMEETIVALKEEGLCVTTLVGGAVLTEDYAKKIGADYYAKDAKESVRIANEFFKH